MLLTFGWGWQRLTPRPPVSQVPWDEGSDLNSQKDSQDPSDEDSDEDMFGPGPPSSGEGLGVASNIGAGSVPSTALSPPQVCGPLSMPGCSCPNDLSVE
jgi:hypothetical protein